MKRKIKILMVTGGTGGHIYPGLALASEIEKRFENTEITFITDGRTLAEETIGKSSYKNRKIEAAPLPRKKFWQICCFLFKTLAGFLESVILLKKNRPVIIIAFGSYISVPVVLAAALMRVPVVLHEQNYFPGMANRFLSFWADRIALTFSHSAVYFPPRKVVVTGNPVRENIFTVTRTDGLDKLNLEDGRVTVLVFGGSQGASDINYSFAGVLPYLEGMKEKLQVVHVCGPGKGSGIADSYREAGIKARIFEYMQKMAYAYSVADIAVCRAGATTVAEIASRGIPAIFVPYPHATSGHQQLNAIPVCEKGGALLLKNQDLSGESLALTLIPLIREKDKLRGMKDRAAYFKDVFRNASSRLADIVEEYV